MKTYEVEMMRTSYITLTVEADSEESAETLAWREIEQGRDDRHDALWEINGIEEML